MSTGRKYSLTSTADDLFVCPCVSVCECKRTNGQVGDEEVGDGAERLEAVDDVDDQGITQNPKHDDGAVGQDQHHLQTSTDTTVLNK